MDVEKKSQIHIEGAIIEIVEIRNRFPWSKYLSSTVYIVGDDDKREILWSYPKDGLKYQYMEIEGYKVLVGFKYWNFFEEIILLEELASNQHSAKDESSPILIEGKTPTEHRFDEMREEVRELLIKGLEEKNRQKYQKKERILTAQREKQADELKKKKEQERNDRALKAKKKKQNKEEKKREIYDRKSVSFWNEKTGQHFFGIPVSDDEWPKLADNDFAVIIRDGQPCEAIIVKASAGGQKKKKPLPFIVSFQPPDRKDGSVGSSEALFKPLNISRIWLKNGDGKSRKYAFLERTQTENSYILNAFLEGELIAVNDSNDEGKFPVYLWDGKKLNFQGHYLKGSKKE